MDTAVHKGKKFWSGVFDAHDGFIREVHPYKKAEAAGFHHSYYVSPQSQDAMKYGDAGFFWVDPNGDINTAWRDAEAPKHIVDSIKSQIDPINKADGGALTDDEGITAYHGTPHDFDQFDTSKIGTGEGAQAYGHGLYFAENEGVAKGYRDDLSKSGNEGAARRLKRAEGNVDAAIAQAQERAQTYRANGAPHYAEAVEEDLRALERYKKTGNWSPGHMYEVHIKAHPDHFLDWDKPVSEQSEHVQKALRPHHSIMSQAAMDMFDGKPEDLRGADLYHWLSGDHEGGLGSAKNVTDHLNKLGIRGIKYLDAGSRGQTDKPTRNYVVFDHNHVAVKRKYEHGGRIYPLRNHTDWEEAHDYEKTGGKLHYEAPEKYLAKTHPLEMSHHDKHQIHHFERQIKKGEKLDPVAIYHDGRANGRHRAHAAKNLGIKKIPVVDWEKKRDGGPIVQRALMVISKKV